MRFRFGLILKLILISICFSACSVMDRADRKREIKLEDDNIMYVHVTDATRRFAFTYPNGWTCSEFSPPAVLESDREFSGKVNSGEINVNIDASGKSKSTAVKLTSTTEGIECLRIAMFYACNIAARNNLSCEQEIRLYKEVIEECNKWNQVNSNK